MRRREEEFLAQIRLRPDEDNIRLIFADWLDEIGDQRAELIRVQCECAQLHATVNGDKGESADRSRRLRCHEEELAALWRQSCLEDLLHLGVKDVRFARGFVERVHLEGGNFLKRTKTLAEWAPAIRGVLWQKIPRLSAEPIQRFFAAPVFSSVTTLNLMQNNLGAAGVEALAGSPGLAGIRSLTLRHNPIGGQGMLQFMNSSHLGGLTRWDLTDTQLSLADARNLARAGSLNQLEELLLSHNQIGDAGLRAIANTARLGTLRKLAVAENGIALEGLRALADSAHLTDLQVLDLSGNEIGDSGLTLMAAASNYARLTELNLAGSGMKPEGLGSLGNSPYFTRLTTLNLSHNPLGNGLPKLLESRVVENLQSLSLRHCDLDSQSVRGFLTRMLPLQSLDLRDNPLINHYTRESLLEKYGPRVLL